MKTRKIHSKIWQDDWFYSLSIESKYMFIYLMTNQYIGLTGIYELAPRVVMFETGLTPKQWEKSVEELSPKVMVYKNWIKVTNAELYDPIRGENNTLWKTRQKELEMIPQEVNEYFNRSPIDPPSQVHSQPIDGRNGNGIGNGIGIGNTVNSEKNENEELIVRFNEKFNKGYVLTRGRSEMLRTRRKTYTQDQLLQAIDNLSQDPFYTGKNDRKWVADPDYLFRNDENIDKAINLRKKVIRRRYSDMID
jgi:hypothetical protein